MRHRNPAVLRGRKLAKRRWVNLRSATVPCVSAATALQILCASRVSASQNRAPPQSYAAYLGRQIHAPAPLAVRILDGWSCLRSAAAAAAEDI